jgi:site-specific DNA recombinase
MKIAKKQQLNKKAVIYCRVSTKEQVDEGGSLGTQERLCREYCERNSHEVGPVFIEQGESAKTANRTELQKLFAYCSNKKNNIGYIVIYKLDRLSRNTDDYSYIRLLLKRYGVEIKSTSESFGNTPTGRFMENTMANMAQFDNDIRAERCAGGMKEAMRNGRYVWMAPVGYENSKATGKTNLILDKKMAPLVKKAFELVASNTIPVTEIRDRMTKEGLVNKTGNAFTKSYYYTFLTNELYTGWIIKFGERHKGTFEALIDETLFDQVQRVLKNKGRKHDKYLWDNPDFPLRRFVVDDEGRTLTGSWNKGRTKKYPNYRFGNKGKNKPRDTFESLFGDYLDSFSFDELKLSKLKRFIRESLDKQTHDQRREVERIKKHIIELENKQSGVIKKNLDGIIPDSALTKQLELIEKDLIEANAILLDKPDTEGDLIEMIKFLDGYLKKPSSVWKNAGIDVQRKLQWFQFPQGLVFENNNFGTTEIVSVFNTKSTFFKVDSALVDPTGIEPATSPVQGERSSQLSYGPMHSQDSEESNECM